MPVSGTDRPDSAVPLPEPRYDVYTFGPFQVDAASLQLLRGAEPIPLPPKAFDTLLVLLRNRTRVISKDELLRVVWRDAFVTEDSLSQTISTLRRVLGDDSNQPRFIATVPRRGYRLIASVTEVTAGPQAPPATPVATAAAERPEPASVVVAPAPPAAADAPVASAPPIAAASVLTRTMPRWGIAAVALAALAITIAAISVLNNQSQVDMPRLRLSVLAPPGTRLVSGGVLSPDGGAIVFVAEDTANSVSQLWVRRMDEADARPIPGTNGAAKPFWSPDGAALGFFAGGSLRTVGLTGDPPQTIASVGLTAGGGAWGPDNLLLFTGLRTGVNTVPAVPGSHVRAVTTLDRSAHEVAHESPQIVPGTRDFLFSVESPNPERAGTYIATLDGGGKMRVLAEPAVFAPPEYLLYVRDDTLLAQRFDRSARRVSGVPARIAGNVTKPSARGGGVISAAANGLVAFGGEVASSRPTWFGRSGQPLGALATRIELHDFASSRDGTQLFGISGGIWSIDIEGEVPTRVVTDGRTPEPSPDGRLLAYVSPRRSGIADVYLRRLVGPDEDTLLLRSDENKNVNDWSPDGEHIVFVSVSPATNADIWLVGRHDGAAPVPYLRSPANEIQARVSPDGRWLAYTSDESGTWEVYVQSFPTVGSKRGISIGGGAQPQWRRDGRELIYLAADHRLMSVEVQPGAELRASRPTSLFVVSIAGGLNAFRRHYLASPDAQRFLVDAVDADTGRTPITILSNWRSLIER